MRRRILTGTLLVTVATLVLFGVPLAWALGRFYRAEQVSRLQQAATVAAAAVPGEGLHGSDPIEPPAVPRGVRLTYYDDRGVLVAGPGPARIDPLASGALAGHPASGTSGPSLVSAQPITANETTIGSVEASSSRSTLAWRSQRAWLGMLALGVVALGAAALIALGRARRLARPVDDLIAAADRLGDGDFTVSPTHSGIAEVDRASQALASTAGRLREMVDRERAFTANASHQLRTPLTALRLSLDNALITPGVDVEQAVRDAVSEADRLQDTLDQLFLLARAGSVPAGALVDRSVPVGEVLRDLERRWHPRLAQRGRRFQVRDGGPVAERRAPATLGQILDILVDNAATHGRGTVEVAAAAASSGFSIGVHDEGDGVPRIPLTPTPTPMPMPTPARPDSENGHGLGLGLAQSLAEAAGGRLVLSASGHGPVVAVILP